MGNSKDESNEEKSFTETVFSEDRSADHLCSGKILNLEHEEFFDP